MSLLSSKIYIQLTEKKTANALKKHQTQQDIQHSQFILNVTSVELEASRGELDKALEALLKAEQVFKNAQAAVTLAKEENDKAYIRASKDKKYYSKLIDEEVDIKIKIDTLELEEKNKVIAKKKSEEHRVVLKEKRKNKNYFSESVLKKISVLPDEIKRIICSYMPFNVRAALLDDKFKSIIARYHSKKMPYSNPMLVAFLDYIATQSEFLGLLTRKEARQQIPSLTPRGFSWRHYSYCGKVSRKLLYNKILWAVEMATIGNPEFAYKIMKTIIVFGEVEDKYRTSFYVSAKKYLTIEDLPVEYR